MKTFEVTFEVKTLITIPDNMDIQEATDEMDVDFTPLNSNVEVDIQFVEPEIGEQV